MFRLSASNRFGQLRWVIAGMLLLAMVIWWFLSFPRGILIGDDLRLVYDAQHGGYAGNPITSLFQVDYTRYRPILTLLFSLVIPIFGKAFYGYVGLNLILEIGNAVLIALIAWRLSHKNLVVSVSAAMVFVSSRFAYYAIFQVFGAMESLALGFLLLAIYDAAIAFEREDSSRLPRILLWFGLSVFTDERYMVVIAFVMLCALLLPKVDLQRRIAFSGLAIGILVANYLLKTLLHADFLEGAGAQPFHLTVASMIGFVWSGFVSTLGFSTGPDYLSGIGLPEGGGLGYAVGAISCLPIVVTFVLYLKCLRRGDATGFWRSILFGLALYVPLLLSASVTFRQEARWLYAPFAIVIISMSRVAGEYGRRRLSVTIAALMFVLISLISAVYYRHYVRNIYYESSFGIANAVLDTIKRRSPSSLTIATHHTEEIQDWIFHDHEFFDEYGFGNLPVTYVDDLSSGGATQNQGASPLEIDVDGSEVRDMTGTAAVTLPIAAYFQAEFSFIDRFGSGRINSMARALTPTGRGVLIAEWPFRSSRIRSLTVLSGYRYSFRSVPIPKGALLVFSGAKPYSIGVGVSAFIVVEEHGRIYPIFQRIFPPASVSAGPLWRHYAIPLDRFSGHVVAITFGANAIGGNQTAAWAAFAEPEVALRARSQMPGP